MSVWHEHAWYVQCGTGVDIFRLFVKIGRPFNKKTKSSLLIRCLFEYPFPQKGFHNRVHKNCGFLSTAWDVSCVGSRLGSRSE